MYVLPFRDTCAEHAPRVGGENVPSGETRRALPVFGVRVSDECSVTADAYRAFPAGYG